jgi:hypothetical protein
MSAAKIKTAVALVAVAGATTGLVLTERRNNELEGRLTRADEQIRTLQASIGAADPSQILVGASEVARLRSAHSELMRLRAEVTELRAAPAAQRAAKRSGPTNGEADSDAAQIAAGREAQIRTLGIEARMSVAKAWGLAFQEFAQANEGRMPRDLEEAAMHYPELPGELKWMQSLAGGEFEITYRGSLSDIENPAQAIVLRERKPFNLRDDGGADRTYLFADGHTEIHHAADGNFEKWEQQRQPKIRATN